MPHTPTHMHSSYAHAPQYMTPGDAGAALARLAPWCLPGCLLVFTCKLQKHRSEAATARDAEEGLSAARAALGHAFEDLYPVWLMTNRSERTLMGRRAGGGVGGVGAAGGGVGAASTAAAAASPPASAVEG